MNHCKTGENAVIKNTNYNQFPTSFDALREHVRFSGVIEISRAVRFIGACLLVILIFSCGPLHATITLSADDDRIESITDLSIDGVMYDATFHHQISPNDLLALYPNGELPFADNPTATLAAEAIRAAVAAAAITPSNGGLKTAYYYVAFGDFSSGVMFAVLDQEVGLPGSYEFNNLQNPSSNGLPNAMPNNQALLSFAMQAAVAAPGTVDDPVALAINTVTEGSNAGMANTVGGAAGDMFYVFDPGSTGVAAIHVSLCKCGGSLGACADGFVSLNDVDVYVFPVSKDTMALPDSTWTKATAGNYFPMEQFVPTGSNYLYWDGSCAASGVQQNDVPISADFLYYIVGAGYGSGEGSFNIEITDKTLPYSSNANAEAPVIVQTPFTVTDGATHTLTLNDLSATDVDTWPKYLQYTVTTGPTSGTLSPASFTQEQLDNGEVSYTSTGLPAGGTDSFSFTVSDGANESSAVYELNVQSTAGQYDNPIPYSISDGVVEGSSVGVQDSVGHNSGDVFYKLDTAGLSQIAVSVCKCGGSLGACNEPFTFLNDVDGYVFPVLKTATSGPDKNWTKVKFDNPAVSPVGNFVANGSNYIYWDGSCLSEEADNAQVPIDPDYDYYIVGAGFGAAEGSFQMQVVNRSPDPPNNAGVCPDTLSQGGINRASASFILHDSIGGIGGVSQTSTSFQSEAGYIPQTLSGCNCITCDDYIAEACVQLQLTPQTSVVQALAMLEGWLAGTTLFSVDICADGLDGAGSSESCSAFILQSFQPDAGE
jgi:hypothetical protein